MRALLVWSGGAHSVSRLLTPWARPVASNGSHVSIESGPSTAEREKAVSTAGKHSQIGNSARIVLPNTPSCRPSRVHVLMQAATQNATNNNAAQASIFLTYLYFSRLGAANEAKASARRPHELPRPRSGKELPKQPQGRRCPRRKASLCHCSTCIRSCADSS
jgi:hypothetical protein